MATSEQLRPASVAAVDGRAADRRFGRHFTWTSADLRDDDWTVRLTEAALAELDTIAGALAAYDVDIEELVPDAFDWPATTELMTEVGYRLRSGVGFAVLGVLPLERWGIPVTRRIGWLLTSLLGPIVQQKYRGARIYDVRDMGKPMAHGVRRSITNLEQEFHTDGGWLPDTPEIIGLACLRQAERGGMSRVSSLATAHDLLGAQAPGLLERLYEPVWWDRQAEHAEGDLPCSRQPIFWWTGEMPNARYYDDYVRQGHRLMGAALDAQTAAALDALRAAIEAPEHCFDFFLRAGQIVYVNNRTVAHARTAFEDGQGKAEHGRHLVRLWVRGTGGLALEQPVETADQ